MTVASDSIEPEIVPTPPRAAAPRTLFGRAFDRMTLVLFVAMHLACLLVIAYPPTWPLVLLALASYLLRMWAVTAGYHRYFSHRSFRTSRAFQFILALLGTTAMQNGPIWWAAWHRRHHKYVDTPLDPHSPIIYGFWYAHVGWVFDPKNDVTDLSRVSDLLRYPELRWLDRFPWVPLVGYAVLCYVIAGFAGLVWGFFVSTIVLNHAVCINSLAHLWGSRRYKTADSSRNNPLLAVLTLGEGWHNNHHYYMSSARQGFFWWEIDLSYYSLKVLSWLRIVHDLREPPPEVVRVET